MKKNIYTKPITEMAEMCYTHIIAATITENTENAEELNNGELDSNRGFFFEEEGTCTHANLWE